MMREPRPLRRLLVAANLLLAFSPHWARAGNEATRATDTVIRPAPNSHPASGKVRPQPQTSGSPRPRSQGNASPSDDDDGAAAAGEVAGACCAGMIGAMAEPSTAEDVDLPERADPVDDDFEEPNDEPVASPAMSSASVGTFGPFDRRQAEAKLAAAEIRARDNCGVAEVDDIHVVLFIAPSGDPFDVRLTPTGLTNTDYGRCVEGEILAVRVPRFDGAAAKVERVFHLR